MDELSGFGRLSSRRRDCRLRREPATLTALGALGSAGFAGYGAVKASEAKPPKLQPTVAMPAPDDAAARDARRRQQEELAATKGRQSTILDEVSDSGDKAYANTTLGL